MQLSIICLFVCFTNSIFGQPLEPSHQISIANNYFGLNLLKQLSQNNDNNVFISPFSISSALGMLFLGSKEDTAQELNKTLGYAASLLDGEQVGPQFKDIFDKLSTHRESQKYDLNIANSLVVEEKFKILDSFKTNAQKYFTASINSTDFVQHNREATQLINDWVKQQTKGKIEKLFDEPLTSDTVMVLLNAIYFKGIWKIKFNQTLTKTNQFHGFDNNSYKVPFMEVTEKFNLTDISEMDSKLLELPYVGNDISMFVMLPNLNDGLKKVKTSLNSNYLDEAISRMKETKVKVLIPKFKFSTQYSLIPYLQKLGLHKVFSSSADLSGIDGSKNLSVSEVIHKAVIEVNEEGSEAAAVTGVVVVRTVPLPPPVIPTFTADHPFAFFIRDNRNGLVLFAGYVNRF